MKRILAMLISAAITLSLIACGSLQQQENDRVISESHATLTEVPTLSEEPSSTPAEPSPTPVEIQNGTTETIFDFNINIEGVTTTDELETHIEEHLNRLIESLNFRWESLSSEIDTYEKYIADPNKVSTFYETIISETNQMCIMLREYSAAYARIILDSDESNSKKYGAIAGINDYLYEDACDEIQDDIYDGLLDEMSDYFYEGILDDAKDKVDYAEWYNTCSDEYSQWYDTCSEVYSLYFDAASDIYSFYYSMSGELYSGDIERAEKIYEKFLRKIDKAKGTGSFDGSSSNAVFDTTIRIVSSVEELETTIDAHVSECTQALNAEWSALAAEIDTYDKYVENIDKIEAFHTHIEDASDQILVMICKYGISYAELIMQSDSSGKDKYNNFEDFKDCIYEDACSVVKDEIYDGILDEIKDYFYDGILNDAKKYVKYSDWSDVHSDAYSWWSDARNEVYSNWSDTRGDIYNFWSDIRSKLYSGDIDRANKKLQNFIEDVEKRDSISQ